MAEEMNNQMAKPTYEQLVSYINQMEKQLNEQRLGEIIAQLNFLFKVVELKDNFPEDYVKKCINEIQNVLLIKSNDDAEVADVPEKVVKKSTAKKSK